MIFCFLLCTMTYFAAFFDTHGRITCHPAQFPDRGSTYNLSNVTFDVTPAQGQQTWDTPCTPSGVAACSTRSQQLCRPRIGRPRPSVACWRLRVTPCGQAHFIFFLFRRQLVGAWMDGKLQGRGGGQDPPPNMEGGEGGTTPTLKLKGPGKCSVLAGQRVGCWEIPDFIFEKYNSTQFVFLNFPKKMPTTHKIGL